MAPVATTEPDLNVIPEDLDARFAELKKILVKPEHREAVTNSWKRLLRALEAETAKIIDKGTPIIPSVKWEDIVANNYILPEDVAKEFREVGTIMIKGVVDKDQIDDWYNELVNFCKDHPESAGYTFPNPTSWYNIFWTKPESEARFHPNIQKLFKAVSKMFYVSDKNSLIDMDTQLVYGDRIRMRQPGATATLSLHLDSSSIERWEDVNYRRVYREILEGRWEDWDPFKLDARVYSREDLYEDSEEARTTICSAFRTLQGWLALSDNKTGEGTLKVVPSLKLAISYVMLRPLFWKDPPSGDIDDYEIDVDTPKFPGAQPSYGQLYLSDDFYPHLKQAKTCVGIPDVNKGDFVFWHSDTPHEVDKEHNGNGHSSVFYYGQTPLSITNIHTLLDTRRSFLANKSPIDYASQLTAEQSAREYQGADVKHIKNDAGLRSMGLKEFDTEEEGLTPGQKNIRIIANKALKEGKIDVAPYLQEFEKTIQQ